MSAGCRELGYTFPGADRAVLHGVTLDFPAGSTTAVLGPSGAGKSTLLRLLAGLLPADTGTVHIPHSAEEGVPVAMVFQDPRLLPWYTVAENLNFALEAMGVPRPQRRERWMPLLDRVGLREAAELRPAALSGGMAQRVGVVRALALRPRVLLLDEPFGAVDPLLRDQLQQLLSTLLRQQATTAVLVTHDVLEAAVLADRAVILGGRPSTVRRQIPVGLGHPRDALDPEVTRAARQIRDALRGS